MKINSKNKIRILTNDVQSNSNKIKELSDENVINRNLNWNWRNRKNHIVKNYFGGTLNQIITLEKISEDIIKKIKVLAYVTSSPNDNDETAFEFSDNNVFIFNYGFLQLSESITKLFLKGTAYSNTEEGSSIPLYWNIYLVYNPIFKSHTSEVI